jgi:Cu/Ag efflux protein CusF
MAVTVTAIDHKTGIVNVSAGDMKLTVHFPPTSLAEVKEGDKITLHLSFTKTP